MVRSFNFLNFIFLVIIFGCGDSESESSDDIVIPEESDSTWNLIWNEEFSGQELDNSKWNILRWRPGWVNNELQAYTNRDTNLYFKDGYLVIRALVEPGYFDEDYLGNSYNSDYTSGRINTAGKFNKTYGRYDIRAKLPKGRGSWPAIWMLGENISTDGWPYCGEIDIMEHVGYEDDIIHGSIHTETFNHSLNTQKSGSTIVNTATDSFHVYSLEWTPNYLRFLVDNDPYFFVYNDSEGNTSKWPFDNPHYIILNLAVGGDWGGVQGVDATRFPMELMIDYVKVYEKTDVKNDVMVTFSGDMKNINVGGTGVYLSGGTLGSGSPGGIRMLSQEGTDIWSVSLSLPKNSTFTYKFRNGYFPTSWSGGWETVPTNCGTGQYNDRIVVTEFVDTVLSLNCFNRCEKCN